MDIPSDRPTSAGHFRELYPLSDWFGIRRSVAIGMRKEACDGIRLVRGPVTVLDLQWSDG